MKALAPLHPQRSTCPTLEDENSHDAPTFSHLPVGFEISPFASIAS